MGREVFEVSFSHSFARKVHARELGDLEHNYPWTSLRPEDYPPLLVQRARLSWTENAFNEHCTGAVMGQLLQALGQARAPLDLISMASRFPLEEAVHVELCARMASRLGGGATLRYDPEDVPVALDPDLTPLQRANELVVCLCCVGEAFSFPMLSGALRSAAHPLTRAVLTTIVRDEAMHGRFGWSYLDWIGADLSKGERSRLGQVASAAIASYRPLWEGLRSRVQDGITSEGFLLRHVHELGWLEAQEYRALALTTLAQDVAAPLSRHGIHLHRV